MLVIEWTNLRVDADDADEAMAVAESMIRLASDQYCVSCGRAALQRLDFGQLATVTAEDDEHGPQQK